jgi:Pentapeptide repeats (9 copies)
VRYRERTQELEVRLAVQTILAKHLKPADEQSFWPGSRINLSGAVLINLDFGSCQLSVARFLRSRFRGMTIFHHAIFEDNADFAGADFDPKAGMYLGDVAWYVPDMGFDATTFRGEVSFYECDFHGEVTFNGSTFCQRVIFTKATFTSARRSKIFPVEERLEVSFHDARVAADALKASRWPSGWTALLGTDEPGWGELRQVYDQGAPAHEAT